MNSRYSGLFGLASLGLALAGPVQAAPDFMDGAFIVAQRERGEDIRQGPRDARREGRPPRRGVEHEEPRGYGYGYERRHQHEREEDRRPPRDKR